VTDGPSVESDLWQYYQTNAPGRVIVLGTDVWNGTPAQLAAFRNTTGATYPLLLNAGTATGGNLMTDYFDRDTYVIIDQRDIVRFNARVQGYFYGAALDVPRMRALVDSLLANVAGVGDGGAPAARFDAAPNPLVSTTRLDLAVPGAAGQSLTLAIYDLSGRRVRTLFDGAAPAGTLSREWDGRDASGTPAPAGVYLARAQVAGRVWTRRLVRLR
jgi:hypothetical protein